MIEGAILDVFATSNAFQVAIEAAAVYGVYKAYHTKN